MDKKDKRTDAENCCSVEYYESWLMELIEQCKKNSRTLKGVLFFSLTVNVILAAVVLFR